MFKPKNIIQASSLIPEACDSHMLSYYHELRSMGHRFYVVEARCGRFYGGDRVITIPLWIWDERMDTVIVRAIGKAPTTILRKAYRHWYISHEMAHAYDFIERGETDHGYHFMEQLKAICPSDAVHFELDYKPKNAMNAGIMPEDF